MELWIRTQNREVLVKTNIIKWEYGCLRGATDDDGWYRDLGKYKKKRALEILDEIQKLLMPISEYKQEIDNLTINYKNIIDTAIYEMPEE